MNSQRYLFGYGFDLIGFGLPTETTEQMDFGHHKAA